MIPLAAPIPKTEPAGRVSLKDLNAGLLTPEIGGMLPDGEPLEQLSQLLMVVAACASRLRTVGDDLPPNVGARSTQLGVSVAAAIARNFPNI